MAIRRSVHVFTMLSTRLSMFGNQTFPRSSDFVLQTLDGLHVQAREILFVVFPRRIRLPDVLSGNTSFIFSSKPKSAVSTDRCLLARCQSPFWISSGTVCKTHLQWAARYTHQHHRHTTECGQKQTNTGFCKSRIQTGRAFQEYLPITAVGHAELPFYIYSRNIKGNQQLLSGRTACKVIMLLRYKRYWKVT